MKGKSPDPNQLSFLQQRLADQLNPKHPLYRLAEHIPWDFFEQEFARHYSHTGRTSPFQQIQNCTGRLPSIVYP